MNLSGFGLGLRTPHYEALLNEPHAIDWLELITENYQVPGGKPLNYLDRIRDKIPLVMHGVSLSIGSTDPIDFEHACVPYGSLAAQHRDHTSDTSDHLCWTDVVEGATCTIYCRCRTPRRRLQSVADARWPGARTHWAGEQILLENVSSYLSFHADEMSEWEFLREVAARADCHILLDINNIYVSSVNHGFDPLQYLQGVPKSRVRQFHLAGHSDMGGHLIDTHDHPIIQPVWDLYATALSLFGAVPTMIERDDNIPELPELVAELDVARDIAARHTRQAA